MNLRTESYLKRKINSINPSSISEIEEKLEPYDLYSLVFLVYDVPATALKGISALSKVSSGGHCSSLISEWVQVVQSAATNASWRYGFLEALTICQLNHVIKKLGFDVDLVQKYFQPDNIHCTVILNPMKKVLYKLCENVTSKNLAKLRATLKTYGLNVDEYKHCEMLILEMIRNDLISVGEEVFGNRILKRNCNIEVLAKIVESIGLADIAKDLRDVEMKYNVGRNIDEIVIEDHTIEPSSKDLNINVEDKKSQEKYSNESNINKAIKVTANDLHDIFAIINDTKENAIFEHLKSDTTVDITFYAIKNRERLGVCCIINQEDFYPSKNSIESGVPPLLERVGSNKDKNSIEETMLALNFDVQVLTNVTDKEMLDKLKYIVKSEVKSNDSMFFLYILSHGDEGYVYAANSVRVKVETMKDLLEKTFAHRNLTDIPKVLIIQGAKLYPDGPRYTPKSNFLEFWATPPELKAYRDGTEEDGSVFIQSLCSFIRKYASKCEHLEDIFTRVKADVATKCSIKNKEQMPMYFSTLSKRVFVVASVEKIVK